MARNPNWYRWILTSAVKHFSEDTPIPLHLDRYDRESDWAEFRFGGPYFWEPSKNLPRMDINIDILITAFIDNDQYKLQRYLGFFLTKFTPFCIYRYGDGEDDDHAYIGSAKLKDSRINTTNYGLVSSESRFVRSAVEGDFYIDLDVY